VEKYRKEITPVPVEAVCLIAPELEKALSSPLSQEVNSNRDPFSTLARPLSLAEYFLFHQCMSRLTANNPLVSLLTRLWSQISM
jgi:hypothetical protein